MQFTPATIASERIVPEPQKGSSITSPFESPPRLNRTFASLDDMEIWELTTGLSLDLSAELDRVGNESGHPDAILITHPQDDEIGHFPR